MTNYHKQSSSISRTTKYTAKAKYKAKQGEELHHDFTWHFLKKILIYSWKVILAIK